MRIAYITAGAGGMICGNCLRDNALARALIAAGHEVQLIPTYTPIRTDEEDVSLGRVFYGGINVYLQQKYALFRKTPWWLDRVFDRPGLLRWASRFAVKTQPQDLGAMTVSVLEGSEGPQRKELRKLIEWLKITRPDVVHVTNSMLIAIAKAVKQELAAPVCCSLQGEDYFLSNLPPPYRERAFELLRKTAEFVDVFIAPSRDHAQAMAPYLGLNEEQIQVVLAGVDLEDFTVRRATRPDEFVIGYLARVSPEKGLSLLAEAVHRIRARRDAAGPRVRLRAAGWLGAEHRPFLEEIRRQCGEWGFGPDFEYLGTVNRAEKLQFLSGLDVLSVPVLYRASKGQYVLEALAAGVPVVQPRMGVFPEIVETTGGGLLFEAGNVEDLARSLERLIDNRAEAEKMGARGKETVHERFHSRRVAEETIAIYRLATG